MFVMLGFVNFLLLIVIEGECLIFVLNVLEGLVFRIYLIFFFLLLLNFLIIVLVNILF